jgi:hypothetical protein
MQHMTLGMINSLERGDVVAFDAHPERGISFDVLGREMSGMLARTDDRLALAMTSPDMSAADAPASGAAQHEEQYAGMASSSGMNGPMPATGYDHDLPPEPSWDNELAS